jgi:hypothetical protein
MSNGKHAILVSLLVLAIPAGISTLATNLAFADTCNKGAHSCANTNLLPKTGCCVVAAASGIHVTSGGKVVSGAGALVNNRNSVEIIATPSANVNPGGHTIAQANGQSAHTPP